MKKVLFIAVITLLIYLSLFPRITEVLSRNYLFGFDQGRDYLAAWSIVKDHKPTLIGSEFGAGSAGFRGLFHGPFHYYFIALSLFISKGDPYGGIVLMFLFSVAAILLGFYVGKKIFKSIYGGFVVALLLSVSPPLIAAGRFVWNSNPTPVFIIAVFYFVYQGIIKKGKYLFLSSFFAAFIYNFQTGIAVPLSLSILVTYLFVARLRKIKDYILLFSGFIAAILPFLFFELRHSFMGTNGLIQYVFQDKKTEVTFLFMQRILMDHMNTYIFNFYDSFSKQNLIPGILIGLFLIITTIIVFIKDKDIQRKRFILFLAIQPFISFFVFSFLKNTVYAYYLLNLNIAYIFLFSYVLMCSYKLKNKIIFYVGIFLFVIFLIYAIVFSAQNFWSDYRDYGGDAKMKGKKDAIDYIYKSASGKEFGLLVFAPPVYTYPYDYIIKWYGETKYNYVPHKEKKGLFFLLIEKDPSKPWSYEGWLETVVGSDSGKVLEQKTLPSGFIIQKRLEQK